MKEVNELKAYLELDFEIKAKVEDAYKKKNETKLMIAKQKKDLEASMWDENKKQIELEKKNLDDSITQTKIDNELIYKEKHKALVEQFKANKDKWIDEIVSRCLGE